MSIQFDLDQIVNGADKQTNFTTQLLKLILKADGLNRVKLALAFPNAVSTVALWQETGQIPDLPTD